MLPALQRYYYHFYYYSYSHISPIPQIRRRRVSGEPVELQQYTVKKVAITTNASFASWVHSDVIIEALKHLEIFF